jgi:3-deoxy-manno-octulosonate cytidylyltransferase (CMP-KDO synthetase)
MRVNFTVVIPARHASTRLPGKSLLEIAGKPLIQHVYESAFNSDAERIIVATDDRRIKNIVEAFGGHALMTGAHHKSGTDRIAEAINQLNIDDETIIVNVQGDEFGLPSAIINQLPGMMFAHPAVPMATLCERITERRDLDNPNIVKVVFSKDHSAIYFSRSPIPWSDPTRTGAGAGFPSRPYRHIGIYGYRAGFLRIFTALPHCLLEENEQLEQLRALYYGYEIYVEEAVAKCGIGVDTPEDLELARRMAEKNG